MTPNQTSKGLDAIWHQSSMQWEVRNIMDEKVENGKSRFLVDWVPTWEPESDLDGSRKLICKFRKQFRR